MTLVQSWIDSLRLLKPKNLQLFGLVTLKSISEAYKLMFKHFWWFILAFAVVGYMFSPQYESQLITANSVEDVTYIASYVTTVSLMWFWLYTILFLGVCFITRPSIAPKDWSYLTIQYKKIILYSFIVAALGISSLSAWSIFLVLFFLDSRGGPKNFFLSMWYALKMIIFNYPLLVIMGVILHLPLWLSSLVYYYMYGTLLFVPLMIQNIVGALLLPIGICTYANIYIKKIHDQFDLYVTQPQ